MKLGLKKIHPTSNGTLKYLCLFFLSSILLACQKKEPSRPNILFIAVDDLRPDLGCYGADWMHSPNIDRLASTGTLFSRHYVSVPTCGASRYSMLTGKRPSELSHLRNDAIVNHISNQTNTSTPETFIHLLKMNGYHTTGIGKISHSADGLVYGYEEVPSDKLELPNSWTEVIFDSGKWGTGWNAFFAYADGSNRQCRKKEVPPFEHGPNGDQTYPDGSTTVLAINKLKEFKNQDQPFFLGVGYFKPHLPFNSPSEYKSTYDNMGFPLAPNPNKPDRIHPASLHNNGEFNQYRKGKEFPVIGAPVSEDYARSIKRAYYSAVSYIDAQIGLLLAELNRAELDKNTIVILWSDHGWHLGEQGIWGKHTLFENALRSPLIIKVPGSDSQVIEDPVESIDLYPTLMDLCGIEPPNNLDGQSLKSSIDHGTTPIKKMAFSFFNRGISLRTRDYRLTKYYREEEPLIELYDHKSDPNESVNIAEANPQLVDTLIASFDQINAEIYK